MTFDVFTDNLDVVDDKPLRIRAKISLIPENEGGRHGPFSKGYRPNHNFLGPENSVFYIGQIDVKEGEWVYPGETKELEVTFINVRGLKELLLPGKTWRIQEGHKLVGTGRIINRIENTQQSGGEERS
jgi:elongation factor Tu